MCRFSTNPYRHHDRNLSTPIEMLIGLLVRPQKTRRSDGVADDVQEARRRRE